MAVDARNVSLVKATVGRTPEVDERWGRTISGALAGAIWGMLIAALLINQLLVDPPFLASFGAMVSSMSAGMAAGVLAALFLGRAAPAASLPRVDGSARRRV